MLVSNLRKKRIQYLIDSMVKIKERISMKIIIITTANKDMKETGFGSMKDCNSVLTALKKRFIDVSISLCEKKADLENVLEKCPDIIFSAVKYIQLESSEKIWLSEYFEDAGINFTGSKRDILELATNKIKAKELLTEKDINTARFQLITPDNYLSETAITIPYPIFLKPLDAANGNGIDDESIVLNFQEFKEKAKKLFFKYGNKVLAEKFLCGREFTVSIIKDSTKKELIISPIEIVPPENKNKIRILGEKVKNENTEELKQITDKLIKTKLKKLANECFKILGARDFGRIDFKMDENNVCNFVEANLVPGMTKGSSYFPKALEIESDIEYNKVVDLMLDNTLNRIIIPE